jgi:hypothetical protein
MKSSKVGLLVLVLSSFHICVQSQLGVVNQVVAQAESVANVALGLVGLADADQDRSVSY